MFSSSVESQVTHWDLARVSPEILVGTLIATIRTTDLYDRTVIADTISIFLERSSEQGAPESTDRTAIANRIYTFFDFFIDFCPQGTP